VPAVVVIDPGHGGVLPESTADKVAAGYTLSNGTWTLGGSSVNNATSYGSPTTEPISYNRSKTEEKYLTLNLGLQLRSRLERIRTNQKLKIRVIMTRTENRNFSLNSRSKKSKEHGADIFYSIHFNGFDPSTVRGSETWIEPSTPRPGSPGHVNENHAQDSDFAARILNGMVNSIPGGSRRGVKEWKNPPTNTIIPTDTYADRPDRLGNEGVSPKSRACLAEVEFITNPDVENHLISGAASEANREKLVNSFADAIILDFKIQE
jgi:N-acetylmuramoyl-L-alanine amidase